jgi:N-acetyl-gamma-glutamyl-phosphate reductase
MYNYAHFFLEYIIRNDMIKVGIIGGSGYSGKELIRLLLEHPHARIKSVFAKSTAGKNISDIYPVFKGKLDITIDTFSEEKINNIDIIFAALPHGESMEILPGVAAMGKKVIDLGGDFRFHNTDIYEKWYGKEHTAKEHAKDFVYGLPELYSEEIKTAGCIANPGCYPTSAILALAPILQTDLIDLKNIVINSLSGVSGAGRKASVDYSYCEVNETIKAYRIGNHQHAPEIKSVLENFTGKKINMIFVPHLVPISRGIYTTIYLKPTEEIKVEELRKLYKEFYKDSLFVRMSDGIPQIQNVAYTNYCDLFITKAEESGYIVINSAIDNLVKGAAGQAIQNMNLMFNFKEGEGLNGTRN